MFQYLFYYVLFYIMFKQTNVISKETNDLLQQFKSTSISISDKQHQKIYSNVELEMMYSKIRNNGYVTSDIMEFSEMLTNSDKFIQNQIDTLNKSKSIIAKYISTINDLKTGVNKQIYIKVTIANFKRFLNEVEYEITDDVILIKIETIPMNYIRIVNESLREARLELLTNISCNVSQIKILYDVNDVIDNIIPCKQITQSTN